MYAEMFDVAGFDAWIPAETEAEAGESAEPT